MEALSWDAAINEIGDKMLKIREGVRSSDSVYWLGSAKFTNERAALLVRKSAAFWGTNNATTRPRICHSTTVAGVAQTWGYGAMTNSATTYRTAVACSSSAATRPKRTRLDGALHARQGAEPGRP